MRKIDFGLDWTRMIGVRSIMNPLNNPAEVSIDLPDDFIQTLPRSPDVASGPSTGYFPGGIATYKKSFLVPTEWAGKSVLLDMDGAYMNAEIRLNGEWLALHPYGYTPMLVDLTPALIVGEENDLEIITHCTQPNSRWYSGGGIFRQVHLFVGEPCHIKPWDLYITTPEVEAQRALVRVESVLTNASGEDIEGVFTIACDGLEAGKTVWLPANSTVPVSVEFTLKNPRLWSAEEPNLYTLKAVLSTKYGRDIQEKTIGIRKIEIDAKNGMRVNGKPVKLLGGCIHHDNTLLGARAFPRAEERKIELLKAVGYNAVRTAHNPPSEALLDACDRVGMYVIDETFDCWHDGKNSQDYHLYFNEWWRRDMSSMVLRDRNHPSIYCWSIGNEIPEFGGASDGVELTRQMTALCHELDPDRPVTGAICINIKTKPEAGMRHKPVDPFVRPSNTSVEEMLRDPNALDKLFAMLNLISGVPEEGKDDWGVNSEAVAAEMDIVGYNYFHNRYAYDREHFPDRVIHATETHASITYDYYKEMMANPNVIGDFIWTAYDNLGEAGAGRVIRDMQDMSSGMTGAWPWLSCFQGDLDLSGDRRPQSYYRGIMWGKDKGVYVFTQHPRFTGKKAHGLGWQWEDVQQCWTYPEEFIGKPVDVILYADCDEVELLVNGKSAGKAVPERLRASFVVPYSPGKLEAVAWTNGQPSAHNTLVTAGPAAKIELFPDRTVIRADGYDLCYISVRVTDEDGVTVPSDSIELGADCQGALIAGMGSGNPCTEENYGTGKRRTWNGKALICLRAPRVPGTVELTVSAEGLPSARLTVQCE